MFFRLNCNAERYPDLRRLMDKDFRAFYCSYVNDGVSPQEAQARAETSVRNALEYLAHSKSFCIYALEEEGGLTAFLVADNGNLTDCHVIYAVYGQRGDVARIISSYVDMLKATQNVQLFCQPFAADGEMISLLEELGFKRYEFPRDWIVLPLDRYPDCVVMRYVCNKV